MRQVIWIVICNIIMQAIFVVCVTLAAIHFERPSMCWWYVLVIWMGYSIDSKKFDKNNG